MTSTRGILHGRHCTYNVVLGSVLSQYVKSSHAARLVTHTQKWGFFFLPQVNARLMKRVSHTPWREMPSFITSLYFAVPLVVVSILHNVLRIQANPSPSGGCVRLTT